MEIKYFLLLFINLFFIDNSFSKNVNSIEIALLKQDLRSCKSTTKKIIILNKLSSTYNQTDLDSSIFYARQAMLLNSKVSDKNLIADSYFSLGRSFRNMGILDSAGYYLFGALQLYDEPNKIIETKIAIGEYYRANSECKKAAIYLNQAIQESRITKSTNHLPLAYNRLAAVYFELAVNNAVLDGVFADTLTKAIAFVDSSFHWSKKLNCDDFNVSNYNILGACYQIFKDYNKAIHFLGLALQEAKSNNQIIELPMIYRNISLNYLKTKQFDIAKKMALTGSALADSLKINSDLAFNYYALMLIGEAMHDDKFSLEYLHKRDSVQYIINSDISISKAKELEAKYKSKEGELLIERQNSELERKNRQYSNSMVWLMFSFIILISGVFFIIRIRKVNSLLKTRNIEIVESSKEVLKLSQFKNDLMGMIVHDLKTPLNTIINISQMNNQKEDINFENLRELNRHSESSAFSMLSIVNNLIDIQKFEEAKINITISDHSINKIIETALKNVKLLLIQKNIAINNTINTSIISKCDNNLIERVLVNLLTNAIKFSPNNEIISISQEQTDGFTKIIIRDNGPGIELEKIPLLFNKFARSEIRNSGFSTSSGLGLAFSKLTVQAHGGEIGVDSEIGRGSYFWFTLKTESCQHHDEDSKQITGENEIHYSGDFLETTLPLKRKLAQFPFYETGEILKEINNFKCDNSEYFHWKTQLENSVLYSNKNKYLELVGSNL